jgi:flagellar L-ring protein precursor FlgH
MKMKKLNLLLQVLILLPAALAAKDKPKPKAAEVSPLDQYVKDATSRPGQASQNGASPGSLWTPSALLAELAQAPRASRVDDQVTVLVSINTSASSTGNTKTSRQSALSSSASSALLPAAAKAPLANLITLGGNNSLQGQGATSRQTTLTTNLSARVTHVLPNGYLVIEGHKDTMINSERETVTVRGVVRPPDLSAENAVTSDRLAELEVRINGKGVVGDSIRRPNALYRILMGILPF